MAWRDRNLGATLAMRWDLSRAGDALFRMASPGYQMPDCGHKNRPIRGSFLAAWIYLQTSRHLLVKHGESGKCIKDLDIGSSSSISHCRVDCIFVFDHGSSFLRSAHSDLRS